MYAVAGVSGRTGATTAEALLKQGQKVRVLVRDPAQGEPWLRRHAEVAVVDLKDSAALTKALTGMTGASLLLPPVPDGDDLLAAHGALTDSMVRAVKASGIKSVCFLSSMGAQHPAGTGPVAGLHRAEKALKGAAPSVTFVRAAYFLENWGEALMTVLETGELRFFGATHLKFHQVCARDIGEAAATALAAGAPGTKVIELAGRENWSPEDVAGVLQSLLETPVKAVAVPVEKAHELFLTQGLSENRATLLAELYQGMARGHLAFAHPLQLQRGTTPLYDALKTLV
jgi:uncharacterized protein YbjT (DUF2867 family)